MDTCFVIEEVEETSQCDSCSVRSISPQDVQVCFSIESDSPIDVIVDQADDATSEPRSMEETEAQPKLFGRCFPSLGDQDLAEFVDDSIQVSELKTLVSTLQEDKQELENIIADMEAESEEKFFEFHQKFTKLMDTKNKEIEELKQNKELKKYEALYKDLLKENIQLTKESEKMKAQVDGKKVEQLTNEKLSLQWENERLRKEIQGSKENELKLANLQLMNDKTRLNGRVITLEKEQTTLEKSLSDSQYLVELLSTKVAELVKIATNLPNLTQINCENVQIVPDEESKNLYGPIISLQSPDVIRFPTHGLSNFSSIDVPSISADSTPRCLNFRSEPQSPLRDFSVTMPKLSGRDQREPTDIYRLTKLREAGYVHALAKSPSPDKYIKRKLRCRKKMRQIGEQFKMRSHILNVMKNKRQKLF